MRLLPLRAVPQVIRNEKSLPPRIRSLTRVVSRRPRALGHRPDRDLPTRLDRVGIAAPARAPDAVAGAALRGTRQLRRDRQGSSLLGSVSAYGVLHRRVDLARR